MAVVAPNHTGSNISARTAQKTPFLWYCSIVAYYESPTQQRVLLRCLFHGHCLVTGLHITIICLKNLFSHDKIIWRASEDSPKIPASRSCSLKRYMDICASTTKVLGFKDKVSITAKIVGKWLIHASESNRSTSFFVKLGTSGEHATISSKLALCYPNVKHNWSYSSFDCNTKSCHHIFRNSKMESKLSCGRTKALKPQWPMF
jgi:hypothetical protein